MYCAQCGTDIGLAARYCPSCGLEHSATATPEQGSTTSYQAFIGPNNPDYYLRKFARFDAAGKAGASWNWPAFFVSFYWLLYRKMWLNALGYFLAPYAIGVFVGLLMGLSGASKDSMGSVIGLAYLVYFVGVFVVFPLYADALYYWHCKAKMARINASTENRQQRLAQITAAGGTSVVFLIIIGVMVFVAIIGILAAIAIPAYQQYLTRAQTAEAMQIGEQATTLVGNYYAEHHGLPETLAEAGLNITLPKTVKAVTLDTSNGKVSVVMATRALADKSLEFVPAENEDHSLGWTCQSQDIPEASLPKACRPQL